MARSERGDRLGDLAGRPFTIAYLFTTFPKSTETFLQREIVAMRARGAQIRLYSLWGGGGEFCGQRVVVFNKWRLLTLFGIIPWIALTQWSVLGELLRGVATRQAPSWLNFWENMLGAGFAGCYYQAFRRDPPTLVHAAWSGGPATAAYILYRLNGHRYSTGAHAYDLYEHGGDWWLTEKLRPALFVHTSTEMGKATLVERGVASEKIFCVRRGLDSFPALKSLRSLRDPLRLICVARLVEKKGLPQQLAIYREMKRRGVAFEARILGDGPLREKVESLLGEYDLRAEVQLLGHRPVSAVWEELAWADVLLHTGVVAASGDRDGLPNVIPEAMAAGVLVVTSPAAATTEAIHDESTGLVAPMGNPNAWITALLRLRDDDGLASRLRIAARAWVEENFDAHRNAAKVYALFEGAVA